MVQAWAKFLPLEAIRIIAEYQVSFSLSYVSQISSYGFSIMLDVKLLIF